MLSYSHWTKPNATQSIWGCLCLRQCVNWLPPDCLDSEVVMMINGSNPPNTPHPVNAIVIWLSTRCKNTYVKL